MIGRLRSSVLPAASLLTAMLTVLLTVLLTACGSPARPPTYPESSWPSTHGTASAGLDLIDPVGSADCGRAGRWTSAQDANTWMQGLDHLPQWRAADVGLTVRLGDGRTLWVFGDTARSGEYRPRFVSSSALVTDGRCTVQWVDETGGFIGNSPGSVCWPSSMAVLPARSYDDVVIGCSRVRRTSTDIFGFDYLGLSIATLRVPHGGVGTRPVVTAIGPDLDDPTQINWGTALLPVGDQMYIYGTRASAAPGSPRSLLLARVGVGAVATRSAWTFWDGQGWVADEHRAAAVIGTDPGVSQALTVHQRGNTYLAVSKKGGDLTDTVALWRAPAPQGPWTLGPETKFPYEAGKLVSYQPLGHPDIPLAGGRLLVSVSRVAKSVDDLLAKPKTSRPIFIEMPLS